MTDIQKELDFAFSLISAIPVKGDSVEVMASAKEHLRQAYRIAGEKDGSTKEAENG